MSFSLRSQIRMPLVHCFRKVVYCCIASPDSSCNYVTKSGIKSRLILWETLFGVEFTAAYVCTGLPACNIF